MKINHSLLCKNKQRTTPTRPQPKRHGETYRADAAIYVTLYNYDPVALFRI